MAAKLVDGLRGKPDVAHDGDTAIGHALDGSFHGNAAFQFYGLAAGLPHKAGGVIHGVFSAGLVSHKGHIADDEGIFSAAHDGFGMMEHFFNGHADGRFITEDDHAQAVADEDEGDAGFVNYLGGGVVIGGNHGDFLAFFLHVFNLADSNAHTASLLFTETIRYGNDV